MTLLEVRDLLVEYVARSSRVAVRGVSFDVAAGETLGLVGESGSGKSTVAAAIARSLPSSAHVAGAVRLGDADVLALTGAALRQWWSTEIALVHQDPQAALNPTMPVGRQIEEVLRAKGHTRADASATTLDLLERVAMPDPPRIAHRYPHELSGGQQQRIVIAMALAVRPRLLILDEPTTGLDATVERGVLDLIAGLRDELAAAVLFITHDIGLVERMCERIAVMQAGEICEIGPTENVLLTPTHEYTRELLADAPRPDRTKHNDPRLATPVAAVPPSEAPLLELRGITTRYGDVVANDDIDLQIAPGEVVGLVGESGSGKTTLGRVIAGLTTPEEGIIKLRGRSIDHALHRRTPETRRAIQVVFQSPDSTLNPKHRVGHVLGRAIRKLGGRQSAEELAASVRLGADVLQQLSATLSGGQKQRVAIARALAGDAELVVCDEPVSALDVSVQATILRLLADLQRSRNLALLFVSHDLGVVRYLADRVVVMRDGKVVEQGRTADLLDHPQHPYTRELVAASEHRAGSFTSGAPSVANDVRSTTT